MKRIERCTEMIDKLDPARNPKYSQFTDIALSTLFADIYHNEIRFNTTHNSFDYFDGRVWRIDEGNMRAERCMKEFSLGIWTYAGDQEKYIRGVAERLQGRAMRKRLLDDSRAHYSFSSEDLDTQENLLNLENGVLDLETFKLLPHDPDLLLSKLANVRYDPEADDTLWLDTVGAIFQNDLDMIRFIHQLYGLGLTCFTGLEMFFLQYGPTTRNGKGTINDTISHLMGDYCINVQPETLMQKHRDSRQPSGDVARMRGARLAISSEPDRRSIWDVAFIKQLTGNDLVTARHLHERDIQFHPVFKLIINTNHLPVVTDSTLFDSDRVLVIPFDRHFTAAERDKNLKRKLRTRENLSGILNNLLYGLEDFKNNGLFVPEKVMRATEAYCQREDKLMAFFRDCIEDNVFGLKLGGEKLWTIADAYSCFSSWCSAAGLGTDSRKTFSAEIRRRGFYQDRGYIGQNQKARLIRLDMVREKLEGDNDQIPGFEAIPEGENVTPF